MIKDKGVLSGVFDMMATRDNLTDITSLVGDANSDGVSDAAAAIESSNSNGWYLDFSISGEKVIEKSVTFNNVVLFTTYIPPGSSSVVCEAAAGNSRIYAMRIIDGNPFVNNNNDGLIDADDRYIELTSSGIAPQPQILFEDDGNTRVIVGTESGGNLDNLAPRAPDGVIGVRWWKN